VRIMGFNIISLHTREFGLVEDDLSNNLADYGIK